MQRKNMTFPKMARTMINDNELSKYFWAKAVNITCYIMNIAHIRSKLKKNPYELWMVKKPSNSYFHAFG